MKGKVSDLFLKNGFKNDHWGDRWRKTMSTLKALLPKMERIYETQQKNKFVNPLQEGFGVPPELTMNILER